jgi:RES domain-containing protein
VAEKKDKGTSPASEESGTGSARPEILEGIFLYDVFADSVRTDQRYFRNHPSEVFLEKVAASIGDRDREISKDSIFWRARLGGKKELVTGDGFRFEEDRPHLPDGMKPISNWQSEGRANPRGIPYLYLASTRNTALAEVRPWIGSNITVSRFKIERDLRVVDCSKHHSSKALRALVRDEALGREDGMWIAIDRAFATPVTREDESGLYIPTQIIAECFKHRGYDGILYKSLLSDDGYNLALFDLSDASVVDCVLYAAASINFSFQRVEPLELVRPRAD